MPLTSTQHRRKCQHSHRVPTTQRPNRPWRRPAWHLALGLAPLLQPPTTQTTEKQGEEMACDSSAQTHLSHQRHWAEVDCAVLFHTRTCIQDWNSNASAPSTETKRQSKAEQENRYILQTKAQDKTPGKTLYWCRNTSLFKFICSSFLKNVIDILIRIPLNL